MKSRRSSLILATVAVLSTTTIAIARLTTSPTPRAEETAAADLEELLSGIDFVPSRSQLDKANVIVDDLINIVQNNEGDPGLRIRAYRALAHYPDTNTEKVLHDAITTYGPTENGVATIYVRVAMHSLAVVAEADAVVDIAPMLDHPSRDVRAAAASALAVTGSADALPFLQARQVIETIPQVRAAIFDAIRILTED